MQRPSSQEYASFYANYVNLAASSNSTDVLLCDRQLIESFFAHTDEAQGNKSYAAGKWTVKEVILHCMDSERIFAYRALRSLRGDLTPLPGYDQDPYVPASAAGGRSLANLEEEWRGIRAATLSLYAHAPATYLTAIGVASGYPVSARALAYIIPGHYLHHLQVLRECYHLDF